MRARGFILLSALILLACSNGNGSSATLLPPTLILVDPDQFADNVSCDETAGTMKVYVATLFDVTGDYDGSLPSLSSSAPTPCNLTVGFGFVTPGRKYQARIDAYDRSDIEPLTPGSSIMKLDSAPMTTLVEPRWTASCGALGSSAPSPLQVDAGSANAQPDAAAPSSSQEPGFLLGPAESFENAVVTVRGCTPFSE